MTTPNADININATPNADINTNATPSANINTNATPTRTSTTGKFEITSSLPSNLATIKPLDGSNYIEWADRMEDLLKCQGLWIILTNDAFEKDAMKKEWLQDKTLGMIKLAINRKAVAVPTSLKKPKDLWDYLQSKYTPKDTMRCITLVRKFHSLIMEETETLPNYIHRVETLSADLEEVGEPISDRMIAWTLLAGLPPKYDSLVMGYAASHNKNDISADSVKRALYFEDSRSTDANSCTQISSSAMFSGKQSGLTCWNCGGVGHVKSTCSSPQAGATPKNAPPTQTRQRGRTNTRGFRGRNKSRNRSFSTKRNGKTNGNTNDAHVSTLAEAHLLALQCGRTTWNAAHTDSSGPANWASNAILVDSGASSTMVCNDDWLDKQRAMKRMTVTSASKVSDLHATATGKLTLESAYGNLHVEPATLVEGLQVSLLSVSQLTTAGCRVTHDNDWCEIWHKATKRVIGKAKKVNGLYLLQATPKVHKTSALNTDLSNTPIQDNDKYPHDLGNPQVNLWHRRLMHTAPSTMQKIHKASAVRNLILPKMKTGPNKCVSCAKGNITRKPINKKTLARASRPLELIVSDIAGPFRVRTISGYSYLMTFIDVYTHYTTIALLRHKSEALEKFKQFHKTAEQQTGYKLHSFRTDCGGEYCSNDFEHYLATHSI